MSDQLVADAATYTTHSKHKRRTSMPLAGFEPVIPVIERLKTYGLFRFAATSYHFQQCYVLIPIPLPLMVCILDTAKDNDKGHKYKQRTCHCGAFAQCLYRMAQKERMFFNLPAISFFGVTSNQKSTFENLVQSSI